MDKEMQSIVSLRWTSEGLWAGCFFRLRAIYHERLLLAPEYHIPLEGNATIESGDTAWMLASTSLCILMTPGMAFFYGGLANRKNHIYTLWMSFICMGVVLFQWTLFGYSFAFEYSNPVWGSLRWAALVSDDFYQANAAYARTFPLIVHFAFQSAFAVLTPAILSGTIIGRVRLVPYILFQFLWTTLVYDALAHWLWSRDGWLLQLGALDFAGGTVVHISSGLSALSFALFLKWNSRSPRVEQPQRPPFWRVICHPRSVAQFAEDVPKSSVPRVLLGTTLLWFGWNGFNGGSELAGHDRLSYVASAVADTVAAIAIVNTNVAPATVMLTWLASELYLGIPLTLSSSCTAVVYGLVLITPASGYVAPYYGLLIGVIGGFLGFWLVRMAKELAIRQNIIDVLDVVPIHGVGGIVGTLLTGLFSQRRYNEQALDGSFFGNGMSIMYQIAAIIVTSIYTIGMTFTLLFLISKCCDIEIKDNGDNSTHNAEQMEDLESECPEVDYLSQLIYGMGSVQLQSYGSKHTKVAHSSQPRAQSLVERVALLEQQLRMLEQDGTVPMLNTDSRTVGFARASEILESKIANGFHRTRKVPALIEAAHSSDYASSSSSSASVSSTSSSPSVPSPSDLRTTLIAPGAAASDAKSKPAPSTTPQRHAPDSHESPLETRAQQHRLALAASMKQLAEMQAANAVLFSAPRQPNLCPRTGANASAAAAAAAAGSAGSGGSGTVTPSKIRTPTLTIKADPGGAYFPCHDEI